MTQAQSDRFAAQDAIIHYAACIDDRDFVAYRALFADDIELHGFAPEPIHGTEAWMKFVDRALTTFSATQHMLGPPAVEIDGDRAQLRTDLQAQHFLREPQGRIFTLWGTYRSVLCRDDGGWKFARHELVTRGVRTSDAYRA
jgi:ketosteroid isomerase-like protein